LLDLREQAIEVAQVCDVTLSFPICITDPASSVYNYPGNQPLLATAPINEEGRTDPTLDDVKLLDGGLVDNYGLAGMSIGMLAAQRPHEPMTAARVRRMMFVVADAGRGLSGNWANSLEGPNGVDLVSAAADTAIDASVRSSYAAFSTLINDWTAKGAERRRHQRITARHPSKIFCGTVERRHWLGVDSCLLDASPNRCVPVRRRTAGGAPPLAPTPQLRLGSPLPTHQPIALSSFKATFN
jgi:hypothetical protein